jgi:hypothetical protein
MDFKKGYWIEAKRYHGSRYTWQPAEVIEAKPLQGRYLIDFGSVHGKFWRSRGELRTLNVTVDK